MRLNITQMVSDLGGATALAKTIGCHPKVPYQWIRQGMLSSRVMELIKEHYLICIDDYFEEEKQENANDPNQHPSGAHP